VYDAPQSFASVDQGDYDAWMARLRANRIDYLVILSPAIEGVWVRAHPEAFRAESASAPVEIYSVAQRGR
jgi:hypothetical protein